MAEKRPSPQPPLGDVNDDGWITVADVVGITGVAEGTYTKASFPAVGLTWEEFRRRADVNRDGKVTARDAQLVTQYLYGTIDTFPYEGINPLIWVGLALVGMILLRKRRR